MTHHNAPILKVDGLTVRFKDFHLDKVSFEVAKGDYFVLLGLSGAGKTVIMEAIAGMLSVDEGSIILDGEEITHAPIGARRVGLLFQDYAVFPHMTVFANIAYPLKAARWRKHNIQRRVESLALDARIGHLLHRKPETLSGGELQRVALCRTLAHDPDLLLLDEPLASLDASFKDEFRSILREINRNGKSFLHITHDFDEAISLANHIAVIEEGTMLQTGTPEEIFKSPSNPFIAKLSGVRNFYAAVSDGLGVITLDQGISLRCSEGMTAGKGYVMIRPEEIVLSATPLESSMTNRLTGRVVNSHYSPLGFVVEANAGFPITALITPESSKKLGIEPTQKVYLSFKASALHFVSTENISS
jgi:molybdopterin-binding protein